MRKNILLISSFVFALFLFSGNLCAKEEVSKNYREAAKKYRFSIETKLKFPSHMSGIPVPLEYLEKELDRFFSALDELGVNFVRKSGLKKVMICRNLMHNGKLVGGVAADDCIYLKYGFSARTVYHEMFHVFDPKRNNKTWQRLNHKDFRYLGLDSPDKPLSDRHKRDLQKHYARVGRIFNRDFVSTYAQSNEVEDRAETFAYMVNEGNAFLRRASRSRVLFNKMLYIIEITSRSSLLGKDYWIRKLGSGIRPYIK